MSIRLDSSMYITVPMRITIDNEEDGITKFTAEFFKSKAEQFNAPVPLGTIQQYETYEAAKQVRSKYPFLIFKITRQDPNQPIRVEDIQGLYCQTPLGKYQFVKNPLS